MAFAENLKKLREKKGLTQAELAKAVYVAQQTIGKYETGISTPKLDAIESIAAALGVTCDELIKGGTS